MLDNNNSLQFAGDRKNKHYQQRFPKLLRRRRARRSVGTKSVVAARLHIPADRVIQLRDSISVVIGTVTEDKSIITGTYYCQTT